MPKQTTSTTTRPGSKTAPSKDAPDKPPAPPTGAKKRLFQTDIPSVSLSEALRVANALRDQYNLNPATPLDVGTAIGIAPTSGSFRAITGASNAYGLTNGAAQADEISLTDLGRRAVAPQAEGDDHAAKVEAFEQPRIIREFVDKYNGGRLPTDTIAKNVLHGMGVPLDTCDRARELIVAGLSDLGYLRDLNGAKYVQRPTTASSINGAPLSNGRGPDLLNGPLDLDEDHTDVTTDPPGVDTTIDGTFPTEPASPAASARPNAIFLGHGKNKKPLDQLEKILGEYQIPYKVAVSEANAGRPIPTKVRDTMHECGAAILIFTADEQLFDAAGTEVLKPSENVAHELGAASVLYDNRIIIFKEEGVTLGSNYSSIGYIEFAKDKLSDKGLDLFRELLKFNIVNLTVGGN